MADSDCICDFPATCGGIGFLECTGCGGDQCVCGRCFGQGEIECPGCNECPRDDEGDDG